MWLKNFRSEQAIFNILANNSQPTLFFYVCIAFTYTFTIVNIAFMVFRKDKRALHDLIAHTIIFTNK